VSTEQFTWPEGEKLIFVRPPKEEYHGNLARFYDPDLFPELAPLKENWKGIRDEVLEFERNHGFLNIMNSLSPAKTEGGNWNLTYLVSFLWKFHKNRKLFPFTTSVVDQIPNLVFAGISILPPHTEIKPHYGDTNGIIRTHLALVIPAEYPTIAIRVEDEERGWKEGELICFINVRKHCVWNRSPHRRYVLMVDFIPKNLQHRTMEICSKALGSQSFIFFYKRMKLVRMMPKFMHDAMCQMFAVIWRLYLPIQRRFEFL